jgi:hypothetical protein
MAGLDPAIHVFPLRVHSTASTKRRRMDGRVKPGHDGEGSVNGAVGRRESRPSAPLFPL